MSLNKLIAKLGFLVLVLTLLSGTAFAQLSTVYVDITNGNDVNNSGANPTNAVVNEGPVATIAKALTLVADNGTISIAASTTGAYEYDDGGGTVTIGSGKSLTLVARVLGAFTKVSLAGLTINQAGQTITIATDGTASFESQAGITLTAGNLNITDASHFEIVNGGTITVVSGDGALTGVAPNKGANLSLVYTGTKSSTAGSESAYGSYGTGTISSSATAGTVTIPNNVTCSGITALDDGSLSFSGDVSLGTNNIVTTLNKAGSVTIAGNVAFTVKNQTQSISASKSNATPSVVTFGAAHGLIVGDRVYVSADADALPVGWYNVTAVAGLTITIDNAGNPGGVGVTTFQIANAGAINNYGQGDITVAGSVTWVNDDATNIAADQYIAPVVNDPSDDAGDVSIGSVDLPADKDGDFIFFFQNLATTNDGKLITGNVTATGVDDGSSGFKYGKLSLTNKSTGTLSTGGTIMGDVTNVTTGAIKITSASTISGNFVNTVAGSLTIDAATTIKGNLTNTTTGKISVNETLTLEGVFSDNAAAGEVAIADGKEFAFSTKTNRAHTTATGSFTGSGYVAFYQSGTKGLGASKISNLKIDAGSGLVTIAGVTANTNMMLSGSLALTGAASTTGTVTLAGGTTTFGTGAGALIWTVENFSQTGGTFTTENSGNRTLDVNGTFSRTGGTFQATNAAFTFKVSGPGSQSINPGATMKVGNLVIDHPTLTSTWANSIEVAGDASTSTYSIAEFGINNITMSGTGTITNDGTINSTGGGGVMFTGASGVIAGTSPYSNIIVALSVGAGNVVVNVDDVKWTGQLTLNAGGIDVNSAASNIDLSPSGSSATISRNLASATTDITLTDPGANTASFNGAGVQYNLTYTGKLTGATSSGSEFTSGTVRDFVVNVDKDAAGGPFTLSLPAAANVIKGDLTVAQKALIDFGTSLEVDKDGAAVAINGIVAGSGLIVSGANATVTGGSATADPATVVDLTLNSKTKAVVSGLKVISGTLTTGASSIVEFGQPKNSAVAGAVSLGGTSFTLTANAIFQAGLSVTKGELALGAYNLTLNTGGAYSTSSGTSVSSTGGIVDIAVAMNGTFNSVAIPYLTVNGVVFTQTDALTVSKKLYLDGAAAALAGAFDVNILDEMLTESTASPAVAGDLTLKGTKIVMAANLEVANLTVDSDTASIALFETSNESATTPSARTITVNNVFTQTLGNVDLNRNSILLAGTAGDAFTRTLGDISQTSGALIFTPAADAVQAFNPGDNWSIANLTVNQTAATPANQVVATDDGKAFTVTGTLKLTQGTLDTKSDGDLHLGNGATISIDSKLAVLADTPTFDNKVNVTYTNTANASTAKELPTVDSVLTTLTVNAGAGVNATLAADVVANGGVHLQKGILDNGAKQVTLASGAVLTRTAGTIVNAPAVTAYELVYAGSVTDAKEYVADNLTKVTVNKNMTWTLGGSRTAPSVDLTASGSTVAIGANTFTVTGDLNMSGGTMTTAAGGSFVLGGTALQTFTVPAAGYTLAVPMTLNNEAGFALSGGNLTMSDGAAATSLNVIFVNGVMTTGDNQLILDHSPAGQGFTRNVADTNSSHIAGNVRHSITVGAGSPTVYANGRYEFPVGSATDYRPYILTFSQNNPAINPTDLIVNHVDERPTGSDGFPIGDIGNYPDFQWKVKATPSSFTNTQLFDLEMRGTNLGYPYSSDQDLRIIRRQDGSDVGNTWTRQGADTGEGNYTVIKGSGADADTNVVVRTTASKGGITTDGTIFTIGMPQQSPSFTAPTWTDTTMYADSTLLVQFTASAQTAGGTVTYALKEGSASFAVIDENGLVTLTPKEEDIHADPYAVTVIATGSNDLSSEKVITVKVAAAPIALVFTNTFADTSIKVGTDLSFQYAANGGDGVNYAYSIISVAGATSDTASITAAGLLTWTPTAADLDSSSVLTVQVISGTDTATTVSTINVVSNTTPLWVSALPDTTVYVGDTLKWTYQATDPDGDLVKYKFGSNFPEEEASLDSLTGEFVWIPVTASAFPVIIPVSATDGEASADTSSNVVVKVITVAVTGTVKYNVSNLVVPNALVTLYDADMNVVDTDSTDATGAYEFTSVTAGEYKVSAAKTNGYGGVLATDALQVQIYEADSTGIDTELQKLAADVNEDGFIDAADASLILYRSVGIKKGTWTTEDWLVEMKDVKVTSTGATADLLAICSGDAKSDYNPAGGIAKTAVSFDNSGITKIKKSAEFKLPVAVKESVEVGSFTLRLRYPADQVEFLGTTGSGIVSNVDGDVISLAWANANKPLNLKEDGVLAQLRFKAVEGFEKGSEASIELLDGSEISNVSAKTLGTTIAINSVTVGIPESFELGQNYPNPFNPTTTIKYGLPANGKVQLTIFNTLGQVVESLVDTKQEAGEYEVKFNAQSMASGVYLYRIIVTGGAKDFVQTKKMLLLK